MNRLRNVVAGNLFRTGQIRNRPRHVQNPVVGARSSSNPPSRSRATPSLTRPVRRTVSTRAAPCAHLTFTQRPIHIVSFRKTRLFYHHKPFPLEIKTIRDLLMVRRKQAGFSHKQLAVRTPNKAPSAARDFAFLRQACERSRRDAEPLRQPGLAASQAQRQRNIMCCFFIIGRPRHGWSKDEAPPAKIAENEEADGSGIGRQRQNALGLGNRLLAIDCRIFQNRMNVQAADFGGLIKP